MAEKPKILIQLDSDAQPSVFDRVVAVDSGVDSLFSYGSVVPNQVTDLVHGAIFTRGIKHLHRTAIFVGGRDVGIAEQILQQVQSSFFGPMRVSVMLDANGANTTAAAAVLAAADHLPLNGATALVLAATGPVGHRVARLLAREGSAVRLASRKQQRAADVAEQIGAVYPNAQLEPLQVSTTEELSAAMDGVDMVAAAGAAGVELLPESHWKECSRLKVAIDLNAVPPVGIAGIEPTDRAVEKHRVVGYGAIGVGGTKMKIHKAAIARLFESNDQVLNAEEIFDLGKELN